jgi:5-methylcytosine-specific restriction endonuclease McrA
MTQNTKLKRCEYCGVVFDFPVLSGRPRLYCSVECRRQADNLKHRLKNEARRVFYLRACGDCGAEFVTSHSKQVFCSKECRLKKSMERSLEKYHASRPKLKRWECKWCGEDMVFPSSYTGTRAYHPECRKQSRRVENRKKSAKRRGAAVRGERVTHEQIAERDSYTCYLCGDAVDMTISRTSRWGATLDHVIPVSKGGTDSEDNLKLAHWICNNRKNDKVEVTYA